ncbi:pseudouridine synthase [Ochromonadaceae sp. CCMP2298]|nr:pseudouridine synthase [Ochromonadaceae sp. CCMP2298]
MSLRQWSLILAFLCSRVNVGAYHPSCRVLSVCNRVPVCRHVTVDCLPVHQCDVCAEAFPSRSALFKHLRSSPQLHARSLSNVTAGARVSYLPDESSTGTEASRIGYGDGARAAGGTGPVRPGLAALIVTALEEEHFRVIVKPQGLATMGPEGETVRNCDQMLISRVQTRTQTHLETDTQTQIDTQTRTQTDTQADTKAQAAAQTQTKTQTVKRYKKALPCHRLDKDTGGLLLCAKSKTAERNLMGAFRNNLVEKEYLAIVMGRLPPKGCVDRQVDGKEATTMYEVVHYTPSRQWGWVSTVRLMPVTGRKHQLRKHMKFLGHVIVGDRRYSEVHDWPEQSHLTDGNIPLFLWAVGVTFPHPGVALDFPDVKSNEGGSLMDVQSASRVSVRIPEPAYYEEFRQAQRRTWALHCENTL